MIEPPKNQSCARVWEIAGGHGGARRQIFLFFLILARAVSFFFLWGNRLLKKGGFPLYSL
jgi:hypothetical protein